MPAAAWERSLTRCKPNPGYRNRRASNQPYTGHLGHPPKRNRRAPCAPAATRRLSISTLNISILWLHIIGRRAFCQLGRRSDPGPATLGASNLRRPASSNKLVPAFGIATLPELITGRLLALRAHQRKSSPAGINTHESLVPTRLAPYAHGTTFRRTRSRPGHECPVQPSGGGDHHHAGQPQDNTLAPLDPGVGTNGHITVAPARGAPASHAHGRAIRRIDLSMILSQPGWLSLRHGALVQSIYQIISDASSLGRAFVTAPGQC